jgi:CO/xanthine dehydrogenase FAD-binding subunit
VAPRRNLKEREAIKASLIELATEGGDGDRPRPSCSGADHALGANEMIKQIVLVPRWLASVRSTSALFSRIYAESPLIELCARAVVADGLFKFVRLGAGGIAPVPLRLKASRSGA